MLVGTPTHGNDWVHAHQAALRILDEYPHTRLLVGGYQPDYIGTDERVIRLPFVEYLHYPTMLAEADVVICAIDPTDPFNYSKSAVKALEAWASKRKLSNGNYGGAAVIATQSVVYNTTVRDGRNGLLVANNVDAYYTALRSLVDNQSLREHLQRSGLNEVTDKHSIHSRYREWVSAYTRIRRLSP
jgi:glycosyltransferase involved in cell wall biosynthesis